MDGKLTCLTWCSLIFSDSHLSSLRYSLREARHARSMTNANGDVVKSMDNAFRSWETSRIRLRRNCWCSGSLFMYQWDIACSMWVRIVVDGTTICQAWWSIMAELAWLSRKMGIKFITSSLFRTLHIGGCREKQLNYVINKPLFVCAYKRVRFKSTKINCKLFLQIIQNHIKWKISINSVTTINWLIDWALIK